MKFVLFQQGGSPASYGLVADGTVISLAHVLTGEDPQGQLQELIDRFDSIRDGLGRGATPIPMTHVRLLPPVPRPGKIVCTTAVYAPSANAQPPQLLATLKSAESVIGPGDTVKLPDVDSAWEFVPQASLGLVIRGPAKTVAADDWQSAVFGVTCVIDVMARGDQQFGRDFWLAKADTLGPLGPCIVTTDEIADINAGRVRSWQNGDAAQDYALSDARHSLAQQLEFVTTVMTLHSGDVLACGTSPVGQRPLSDGDLVEVEIDGIGRLVVNVAVDIRSAV